MRRAVVDAYEGRDDALEDKTDQDKRAADMDAIEKAVEELSAYNSRALGVSLPVILRSSSGASAVPPVKVLSDDDYVGATGLSGLAAASRVEFVEPNVTE